MKHVQYVLIALMMTRLLLSFGLSNTQPAKMPEFDLPSPEKALSIKEATMLYQSVQKFVSDRYSQGLSPYPLPEAYIRLLERILLDFPDEKFVFIPKGLGLKERVEYGSCRAAIAASYWAQGKWSEALALEVQDLLIRWIENLEFKAGFIYGFPAFPFPNPFREENPPPAVLQLANRIKGMQDKGAQLSPVIFVGGWPLRARWKGDDPTNALVSLNDIAFALGKEKWREIIQRDWKEWRFTLSVKNKTITFKAGSKEAVVSGKKISLRHKVERSFYDLYVPLGDLVKALGGNVRPPKADELNIFQNHLPVPLLVLDLMR